MRNAAFVAILAAAAVPVALAQTKWRQVSSFTVAWDNHANVRFALSIPATWNDPGDFTRISIRVPGRKQVVLTNDEGWVKYRSAEASASQQIKKSKNLIASDYLFAGSVAANRTVLFLFGYSYASSPGSLDIVEISGDGDVRVVLHRSEFGLRDFHDLDGDGIGEVVGYPCLSQPWGNGLLTYDPFNVYKLSHVPAGPATLSIPLSKTYNLQNYYGWVGPKCSEDFAVVLHPPKGGKPVVLPAKEAERMMESTGNARH
ncbi:MAG: hypothetical protein ACHP9S_08200 [Terriglobales bacterium]